MNKIKNIVLKTWQHFMHDSMYRNSIFLVANTIVLSGAGFIFWALAARFYSAQDVGVVAALISASALVNTLASLGFDSLLIRFLPKAGHDERKRLLNTSLTLSAIASLIISAIYLIIVKAHIPELSFLYSSMLWIIVFLFFMLTNTLNNLTNIVFIAYRVSYLIFWINLGFAIIRIVGLLGLLTLGQSGLLFSHILATALAMLATFIIFTIVLKYKYRPQIVLREVSKSFKYASASYFYTVFYVLPTLILPTVIINKLGTEDSAYYYIVSVIIAALLIIPQAISQSLFAESSWDDTKLKHNIIRASKAIFTAMIPAILFVCIFGNYLLQIFGKQYENGGYALLVMLALSALPRTLNTIFSVVLRIKHQVNWLAVVYLIYSTFVIIGSYFGILKYGIVGIGYVTIVAECIVTAFCLSIVFIYRRKGHASN